MTETDGTNVPNLQLFVVGDELHSTAARRNLEEILQQLQRPYEFKVIDILRDYRTALDAGILIAPALLITTSNARIIIAGDMEDRKRVLSALKTIA